MARTLTQIYTEAVAARNNYLQLTEIQPSLLSTSKLSIINLITYIASVVVYSYETVLDVFKIDMLRELETRMNGTAEYYLRIARLFQYNSTTQSGYDIIFNEDSMKIEYQDIVERDRIIDKVAYQMEDGKKYHMTLKVAKNSGNTGERGIYSPLTNSEMAAFIEYINKVKFVGVEIACVSLPGDILNINHIIYYDNTKVTGEQAYDLVRKAILKYLDDFNYNDYVYYQGIVDMLQQVSCVTGVEANGVVTIQSYNNNKGIYEAPVTITNRNRPQSGFLVMVNTTGESNLTYEICQTLEDAKKSTKNLKLVPKNAW